MITAKVWVKAAMIKVGGSGYLGGGVSESGDGDGDDNCGVGD